MIPAAAMLQISLLCLIAGGFLGWALCDLRTVLAAYLAGRASEGGQPLLVCKCRALNVCLPADVGKGLA